MDPISINRAFAKRLGQALTMHPASPAGYGRNTWLKRALDDKGLSVSNETIRKWLAGETIPRRGKMSVIAETLRVDTSWLAMGVQPSDVGVACDRILMLEDALLRISHLTDEAKILTIIQKALGRVS